MGISTTLKKVPSSRKSTELSPGLEQEAGSKLRLIWRRENETVRLALHFH